MKNKWAYSVLLLALSFTVPSFAARQGKANLIIQQISPANLVSAGDTLTVALWVDAQNEPITGVAVYLTLDETCLQIVPHHQTSWAIRPFRQGNWMGGTVFSNGTLGDELEDPMANNQSGFQLLYFEDIPVSGFSGSRRTVDGKGILTEVRLVLLQDHPDPLSAIRIDHISPTGSESGYFHVDHPGTVYSLNVLFEQNLAGDFNGDYKRDFQDFLLFVQRFGQTSTDSDFSAIYDLNGNNAIDFADFIQFTQLFQQ